MKKFDVFREKMMHLIIVNKDLSFFEHIYPKHTKDGLFKVSTTFPRGGDYQLIADFVPLGLGRQIIGKWEHVDGKKSRLNSLDQERELTKIVKDIEVTLTYDKLQVGKNINMTFSFKDVVTSKPITDLDPFLGAIGYVVILSADSSEYLHNQPLDENTGGLNANFVSSFPNSGIYKIWGQFQQDGRDFIVDFVINVP